MLQAKGQNRDVYFLKVILDYIDALVSHTNIVFVPHLVNWNLVTLVSSSVLFQTHMETRSSHLKMFSQF